MNDPKHCKRCKAKRNKGIRPRPETRVSAACAEQRRQFRLSPLKENLCSAGHAFSRGEFQKYLEGRMDFVDRDLICVDCGAEFTFSAAEQILFHDKQLRTPRNGVGNAERGATVDLESRFALKLPVRNADRGQRFSSRPIDATRTPPCFQKTQSETDPAALQNVQSASHRPACVVIPFRAAKRKFSVFV